MDDRTLQSAQRLADRFTIVGTVMLLTAAAGLVLSLLVPVKETESTANVAGGTELPALPETGKDLKPLLVKMAGVRLIKPPQVQAAVKDTGAAAKLVKKLALQGVVRMGDELVAYISVVKEGVKTVRRGGHVLEFVVEDVAPGKVTLSLQGVQVVLEH